MWKRPFTDPVQAQADELTLECELLLSGRYAPMLRAQEREVPPWAWAGVLAHGSAHDLQGWAASTLDGLSGPRTEAQEWRQTVAFLAEDLLNHVTSTGVSLPQLQRTAIVPIELDLMASGARPGLRPGHLAGLVLAAVHGHPSRHER